MDDLPDYFPWLLLQRLPGIGPRRYQQLLDRIQHPRVLFHNPESLPQQALSALPELSKLLQQRDAHPIWQQCLRDVDYIQQHQIQVMTLADADYPPLLCEIVGAPPVVYIKGDRACLSSGQLAVVGARKASKMALQVCYDWSQQLASQGVAITSGLALGVDGAAHRGALAANGVTVAVMAQGINQIYPRRHAELAETILERGALISEFPLFTEAKRDHFPRRNRIISGLSQAVFVAEAAIKSGSLITARYAAEQNRDVFAMPGSINNPMAKGCHHLIKQGAFLTESVEDITAHLSFSSPHMAAAPDIEPLQTPCPVHLQSALERIPFDYTHLDQLINDTQLPAAQLTGALLELELDGWVESQSAHYRRIK